MINPFAMGESLLALKEFRVEREPQESTEFIRIAGRRPGIVGWLLSRLGIDPTTTFVATDRDITFDSSSMFGKVTHVVPLTSVASASSGMRKPMHYLGIGLVFFFGGITSVIGGAKGSGWVLLLCLAVASLMFFLYATRKRFSVSITSSGGTTFGVAFKKGFIEGESLDPRQASQAARVIRDLCSGALVNQSVGPARDTSASA